MVCVQKICLLIEPSREEMIRYQLLWRMMVAPAFVSLLLVCLCAKKISVIVPGFQLRSRSNVIHSIMRTQFLHHDLFLLACKARLVI